MAGLTTNLQRGLNKTSRPVGSQGLFPFAPGYAPSPIAPTLKSPIPYQKIILGNTPNYNLGQHFNNATSYGVSPATLFPLQAGLTVTAGGFLTGLTTAAGMDAFVTIRAYGASGTYVDAVVRVSVAQNPGAAPGPTMNQTAADTITITRTAVPANVPAIHVDLLFGATSPLTSLNGQLVYDALTGPTTYILSSLAVGATRYAKQRWRVAWGDGTFFPSSFAGSQSSCTLNTGTSAPSPLVQPDITPLSGQIGTVFTFNPGTCDGNPAPNVALLSAFQNGVDVTGSVVNTGGVYTFTATAVGPLVVNWRWSNGIGSPADATASATVTVSVAAPSKPTPPILTPVSQTEMDAAAPADPFDGNSPINYRELRYSLDQVNWTAIANPSAVYRIAGLTASTTLYAVWLVANNVGPSALSDVTSAQTLALPTTTLTLTEIARDRMIYDSGAAFGLDYAAIPFAGTGPAGEIVQARVYSDDDQGATSSMWVDLATIDGAGNYSGTITAVLNKSWLRKQVRLKTAQNSVVSATNRCAVGHVHAIWGQGDVHRLVQPAYSNVSPEALLTIKQQVQRLILTSVTGRNSTKPLKVAGVDTLPAGVTISGRDVNFTGTGTLSDWDFRDYRVTNPGNCLWKFKQCLFREVVGGQVTYLMEALGGGRFETYKCTFTGKPGSGLDACINEKRGASYGKTVHRYSRIDGSPGDGAKLSSGEFYNCYITIQQNLKKVPTLWSAATTYAVDDYVYITVGSNTYAYASLVAGNLNNQPPTDGDPNNLSTLWRRKAPHSDLVTVLEARETVILDRCYLDFGNASITTGAVGLTNNVRIDANPSGSYFAPGLRVRYCYMDRLPTNNGIPVQIANTIAWAGPILFERCWIKPRNAGGLAIQAPASGPTVTVSDCENLTSGGALATPANCIQGTSTAETNDDVVQVVYHDRVTAGAGGVVRRFVSNAAPYTAAISSVANTYLAERPGEKVCIVFHAKATTGFADLFNDSDATRYWADDLALHNYVCSSGVNVGVASMSWFGAPNALGQEYGRALFELATGLNFTTGAALGVNGSSQRLVLQGDAQQITCDHLWSDIYDYAKTKWLISGPQRFEPDATSGSLQDATHKVGGAAHTVGVDIQDARTSLRAMLLDAKATMFLGDVQEPFAYENGYSPGAGAWTDISNPSDVSVDGLLRFGRLFAHALLSASNLTGYVVPKFDNCLWDAAGAYVEIWSSAGPITSTRIKRGDAALAGQAHYGDVMGFQLRGAPVPASIVAGRVRITPPASLGRNFNFTDTINFGEGGAPGQLLYPTDNLAKVWKNAPIVDLGIYGLEGAAVRALPDSVVLANTIPPPTLFPFVLVNEQGSTAISAADVPELEISTNFGSSYASVTSLGLTFSIVAGEPIIDGLVPPGGGWAAGQVRVRLKDGAAEPYYGQDTPQGTDQTGTVIKELYARHATNARPALGAVTPNLLPGLPIAGTRWGVPVVAT